MLNRSYKKVFFIAILTLLLFITSCSCGGNNSPKTKFAKEGTTVQNLIAWVNQEINKNTTDENGELLTEELLLAKKKENAINLINNYIYEDAILTKDKYIYMIEIVEKCDIPLYTNLIEQAKVATDTDSSENSTWVKAASFVRGCTSASNSEGNKLINQIEKGNGEELNVNDIVCAFTLRIQERLSELELAEPIKFYGGSVGEFFSKFFNNMFIFPIAWLIVNVAKIFGGLYVLGLLIVTLLVRTVAWPIYAKTNDMSLKMQLMQPELNAIQAKYANKTDERSKQMMQMETAHLYKKYKVGLGGCFMPFLQFPIFMAIYRAVSRIPYTVEYIGTSYTNNWANEVNPNFFGLSLFEDRTTSTGQFIGIIILMLIVVGTQFLSQWLSERRQKKNKEESQADIPAYRRQAYEQQKNSSQSSMKMMLYMMMLMMGMFVFTSKAGLGFYWCIGNVYSIVQAAINNKTNKNRMEKLKSKF